MRRDRRGGRQWDAPSPSYGLRDRDDDFEYTDVTTICDHAVDSSLKPLKEAGIYVTAPTLETLAIKLDMEPSVLAQTVERFNGFCATGVDEDFDRGRTAYDNYYGDPGVKPNPNLGPIEKGPFHAVQIVPGDLGTKGGLLTDERARVLRPDGSVIEGLYAAGNASSAVMGHTYPGPGGTIGPALVFGYLAADDLATATPAGTPAAAPAAVPSESETV